MDHLPRFLALAILAVLAVGCGAALTPHPPGPVRRAAAHRAPVAGSGLALVGSLDFLIGPEKFWLRDWSRSSWSS